MFIEITEQYLANIRQELKLLKHAQEMAKSSEVIPMTCYRIDMQNLIGKSIVSLQQIIERIDNSGGGTSHR